MKIVDVVCSGGRTGFFFDDQRAIKAGAEHDGEAYKGEPVTEGFKAVRQPGESITVMLVLEDGQIAMGDCAAVQYSGAGGRDPLFVAEEYIQIIDQHIKPLLVGLELTSFKEHCEWMDTWKNPETNKRYHTALRYGLSQAFLDAVAKSQKILMTEVVEQEYNLPGSDTIVPIFTQSGDNRYNNVDKMIIKGANVLPHALINHVEKKLGLEGEKLVGYVEWLRDRIMHLRIDESYNPVLHIDVYGTIGIIFDYDIDKMVDYMAVLEEAAKPLKLRIEGPMDMEERTKQMEALSAMTKAMDDRGIHVELVADEWCNTLDDIQYFTDNKAGHMVQIKTPDLGSIHHSIEAVLYCKERGMGAYLGGTCNETDISARACAHVAMATEPVQTLAKPGMGVDEGYMIVFNEMQRILAIRKAKRG
jgi:methylaspartate ammonia-lyase